MGPEEMLCARAPDRDLVSFDGLGQRRRIAQQRPTVRMNKRIALFPGLFFEVYLTLSVLTFAFGPWSWPVSNPLELYGFVALAQSTLFLGYWTAIYKPQQVTSTSWRVSRMIAVSLLLNLAWLPQQYKARTGAPFSFGTALGAVAQGSVNPSTQYLQRF